MTNLVATLSIILVLFLFIDERKLNTTEQILDKYISDKNEYVSKLNYIKRNIINIQFLDIKQLKQKLNNINKEYVFIFKEGINIEDEVKEKIIGNYLLNEDRIMFIKGKYNINTKKDSFTFKIKKGILVETLNYINIFNKEDVNSFDIIVGKKINIQKHLSKENKYRTKYIDMIDVNITLEDYHDIFYQYKQMFKRINVKSIIKIGIFMLSTGSITWSFIRALVHINQDIYMFLVATAIYYCYIKVVKRMYLTIKKIKYIAPYVFFVYIIIYISAYLYIIIYRKKRT